MIPKFETKEELTKFINEQYEAYRERLKHQIEESEISKRIDLNKQINVNGEDVKLIDFILMDEYEDFFTLGDNYIYDLLSTRKSFSKKNIAIIDKLYNEKNLSYKAYIDKQIELIQKDVEKQSKILHRASEIEKEYEYLLEDAPTYENASKEFTDKFDAYMKKYACKNNENEYDKIKIIMDDMENDITCQNAQFYACFSEFLWNCEHINYNYNLLISLHDGKIEDDASNSQKELFDDNLKTYKKVYAQSEKFFNVIYKDYNEKISGTQQWHNEFQLNVVLPHIPQLANSYLKDKNNIAIIKDNRDSFYDVVERINKLTDKQKTLKIIETEENQIELEKINEELKQLDEQKQSLKKDMIDSQSFIDAYDKAYKLPHSHNAFENVTAFMSYITLDLNIRGVPLSMHFNNQYIRDLSSSTFNLLYFLMDKINEKNSDNAQEIQFYLNELIKDNNGFDNDANKTRLIENIKKQLTLLQTTTIDIEKYIENKRNNLNDVKEEIKRLEDDKKTLKDELKDKKECNDYEESKRIEHKLKTINSKIELQKNKASNLNGMISYLDDIKVCHIIDKYDIRNVKDEQTLTTNEENKTMFTITFAHDFYYLIHFSIKYQISVPCNYEQILNVMGLKATKPMILHCCYLEKINTNIYDETKVKPQKYRYKINTLLNKISDIPNFERVDREDYKKRIYAPFIEYLEALKQNKIIVYRLHPSLKNVYIPKKQKLEMKAMHQDVKESMLKKDFQNKTIFIKLIYDLNKIKEAQKELDEMEFKDL